MSARLHLRLGTAWLLGLAASVAAPEPVPVIRAQLQAQRYTTISAELGAKVVALPLPEGGRFRAGDLLVALDDRLPRAQLQRAEADLAAARVGLESNVALEKLNSVGRVELEQSRAAVARAEAEVAGSRALLEKSRLVAPYDGRIAEQRVRELQFVQAGQALLEILDDRTLELEFIVPSRWLAWLRADAAFTVAIDETGRSYPARVTRLGARVDPVSQTIKISGLIEGQHPELLAGMSGRVELAPPAP